MGQGLEGWCYFSVICESGLSVEMAGPGIYVYLLTTITKFSFITKHIHSWGNNFFIFNEQLNFGGSRLIVPIISHYNTNKLK